MFYKYEAKKVTILSNKIEASKFSKLLHFHIQVQEEPEVMIS